MARQQANSARSPHDAAEWLPDWTEHRLRWTFIIRPGASNALWRAEVQLWLVEHGRQPYLYRFWGEMTSPKSPEAFLGAWLRAAIEASSWAEGKNPAEIKKAAEWDHAAKSFLW